MVINKESFGNNLVGYRTAKTVKSEKTGKSMVCVLDSADPSDMVGAVYQNWTDDQAKIDVAWKHALNDARRRGLIF